MTTAKLIENHKYFLVAYGCLVCPGRQYLVKYGKIENEVGDTHYDLRPVDERNKLYRVLKKDAYDTLDEAEHKAISEIESNAVTAKSVLNSSIQLLKFN